MERCGEFTPGSLHLPISLLLRFSLLPDAVPIEVTARVARETETGFAVEFAHLDSRLRSILRMAIHRARQAGVDVCTDEEEGRTLLGPRSY